MDGLKSLMLSGDGNSLKALKIDTLAPLRELPSLERLTLTCLRVADGSLAPLADMPGLRLLRLANQLPMEAVAWLAGRRPDVDCDLFTPDFGPVGWHACRKCRQKTVHGLTGKGKPWLCAQCDADRLAKHRRDFAALVAAAAASA